MTNKKKIPVFKSAAEEARFWETHSVTDYLGQLEEVDTIFALSPELSRTIHERSRKKAISLRLFKWEIDLAKRIAKSKKVPYQRLLREWIDAGIKQDMTRNI